MIGEFLDLYPDVRVELILSNEELDLAMREADVAIRLRRPAQPDLIQRRLFTVHFHAYASKDYIKRFGEPKSLEDLDNHRIVSFGGDQPSYLMAVHWLSTAGREPHEPRGLPLRRQQHHGPEARGRDRRRHRRAARLRGRRRATSSRRSCATSRCPISTAIWSMPRRCAASRGCRRSGISSSPRRSAGPSERSVYGRCSGLAGAPHAYGEYHA